MSELIFILLFFGTPGILGFILARKIRKNPFIWGVLCSIFPFFLVILTVQDRNLLHQVMNNKQNIVGGLLLILGAVCGSYVLLRKSSVTGPFGEIFNLSLSQENLCILVIAGVLFLTGVALIGLGKLRKQ